MMNTIGHLMHFLTLLLVIVYSDRRVGKKKADRYNYYRQLGPNETCCGACDPYPFVTVLNRIYEYNYASMGQMVYFTVDRAAVNRTAAKAATDTKRRKKTKRKMRRRTCQGVGFKDRLYMKNLWAWACAKTKAECWMTCQKKSECHSMTFVEKAELCLLYSTRNSIGSRAFSSGLNFTIIYLEKEQCKPRRRSQGQNARPNKLVRLSTSTADGPPPIVKNHKKRSKITDNHLANGPPVSWKKMGGEIAPPDSVGTGGRQQRSQTTKRRWKKKNNVEPWSGTPGVAYFGFQSFNDVLNPDDGIVALRSVPHSQPWLVNIQYGPDHTYRCSGVLLPPLDSKRNKSDLVITSAHCLDNRKESYDLSTYELSFGVVNYDLGADSEVRIPAKARFIHPYYDQPVGSDIYDVGIIKLAYAVHFNMYVAPIALPQAGIPMPNRRHNCVVAGWNLMRKEGFRTDSKAVHHAGMRVLNDKECLRSWPKTYDPYSMICSKNLIEIGTSCDGDSGGPLTCKEDRKQWILYGIVSTGESKTDCRNSTKPLISARVAAVVDWINSIREKKKRPRN